MLKIRGDVAECLVGMGLNDMPRQVRTTFGCGCAQPAKDGRPRAGKRAIQELVTSSSMNSVVGESTSPPTMVLTS